MESTYGQMASFNVSIPENNPQNISTYSPGQTVSWKSKKGVEFKGILRNQKGRNWNVLKPDGKRTFVNEKDLVLSNLEQAESGQAEIQPQTWFKLGERVNWTYKDSTGNSSPLKPNKTILKNTADNLGITLTEAERALSVYNSGDPQYDENLFKSKPIPTVSVSPNPVAEKQPWEMTRQEWLREVVWPETEKINVKFDRDFVKGEPRETVKTKQAKNKQKEIYEGLYNQRGNSIKQALSEGKPVPAEVIKEYPELTQARTDVKEKLTTESSAAHTTALKNSEIGQRAQEQYAGWKGKAEGVKSDDMTIAKLNKEVVKYKGIGGISTEAIKNKFIPGFRDSETGLIYPSLDENGRPTGIHLLDGLPESMITERNKYGDVTKAKASLESGFIRDDQFYTRDDAVAAQKPGINPLETISNPAAEKQPWEMTQRDWNKADDIEAEDQEGIISFGGPIIDNKTGKWLFEKGKDKQGEIYFRAIDDQKKPVGKWTYLKKTGREMLTKDQHKDSVKQALSGDLPVPPEVLAEYPDLVPRTEKVESVPGQNKTFQSFITKAYQAIDRSVFRERVPEYIQRDGQRLLDALGSQNKEVLKELSLKYHKDAGRDQGGRGAGPGKTKEARPGTPTIWAFATEGIKELSSSMPQRNISVVKEKVSTGELNLTVKNFDGTAGNGSHTTRIETGTVPVESIKHLQGGSGEQRGKHARRSEKEWEDFKADIQKNGVKKEILILKDPGKEAVVSEGNHRLDAAIELGLKNIPVEIRYFGKSENEGLAYITIPASNEIPALQESKPGLPPIRYNSSTDKYDGGLENGDTVTDGQTTFIVTRKSGYTLQIDEMTEAGRKIAPSRSVDPTSPEFKGDLWKIAIVPVSGEPEPNSIIENQTRSTDNRIVLQGKINEKSQHPKSAILQLLDSDDWKTLSPAQINNGNCDAFAFDLQELVGGEVFETPLDGDLPTHFFVKWHNKFYDAQNSEGVDDFMDLSIFKFSQNTSETEENEQLFLFDDFEPDKPTVSSQINEDINSGTEDAGEELTYNKRNRIKTGIKWDDIKDKKTALRVQETIKQNVYPRPDYQQLINDGMEPASAYLIKQVYDSISARSLRTSDDDLKNYIEAVNLVMERTINWVADQTGRLYDAVYPEGWRHHDKGLALIGGNKVLRAIQPGYHEKQSAQKAIAKGWPAKQEKYQVRGYKVVETQKAATIETGFTYKEGKQCEVYHLDIEGRTFEYFSTKPDLKDVLSKFKSHLLLNKYGKILNQFDSEDAATSAAKELVKKVRGEVVSDKGISVEAAERIGEERRLDGEDITSEKLKDTFAFKGINFGNWMKGKSNEAERQLHLNHAYDSFMDLADVLGIPPEAISLNGMLGLAIGAQGSGAHAAHFVPGVNEVNLTRTHGAGSLGHEYAHALDHYFANQAGFKASIDPFLSEHTHKMSNDSEIRPEIFQHFKAIVEAMNKKNLAQEEIATKRETSIENSKRNIESWLNFIKKSFTGYEDSFDKIASRMINSDYGEGRVSSGGTSFFPVLAEMRDLHKKITGRIYSMKHSKSLQYNLEHLKYLQSEKAAQQDHQPQKTRSDYSKNAIELDKQKKGKPYWSTDTEMFARAFDAYISDTLEKKASINTYLSHAGRTGNTVPDGEERKTINKAFDALIADLKTKKIDEKTILFSTTTKPSGQTSFLSDFQKIFKDQRVGLSNDGSIWVRLKNGAALQINTVKKISEEFRQIAIQLNQIGPDEIPAGGYFDNMVFMTKAFGDRKTAVHEVEHWLEDIGVIIESDQAVLDSECESFYKDGLLNFDYNSEKPKENRANFFAQYLEDRRQFRQTKAGLIFQKAKDFLHRICNPGKSTVRKLAIEMENGKLFNRTPNHKAIVTTVPQFETLSSVWHSQMTDVLKRKLNTGEASSVKSQIQSWAGKEFKLEELEWSGLLEWLDTREGKVTKTDILEFLETNHVGVEDVIKGWTEEPVDLAKGIVADEIGEETDDTIFSKFQIPGGKNYKEFLLTLAAPKVNHENLTLATSTKDIYRSSHWPGIPNVLAHVRFSERVIDSLEDLKQMFTDKAFDQKTFDLYKKNFEEKGFLKILHLEEIQSDLHQEGKKRGYIDPVKEVEKKILTQKERSLAHTLGELERAKDIITNEYGLDRDNFNKLQAMNIFTDGVIVSTDTPYDIDNAIITEETLKNINKAEEKTKKEFNDVLSQTSALDYSGSVPDAPFKKTWPMLAVRRMVRYGAENGFDIIAWTQGEQQAERYDLSKKIKEINYEQDDDGSDNYDLQAIGHDDQEVISEEDITLSRIEELVGKEIAEKIKNKEGKDKDNNGYRSWKSLSGLELQVGGEGLKTFYDQILPAETNKFFNKNLWGNAKIGKVEILAPENRNENLGIIDNEDGTYSIIDEASGEYERKDITKEEVQSYLFIDNRKISLHAIPITPQMRSNSLRKGMPLFKTIRNTETQAFKNWFGKSKVVDEQGKPLVVYHGTPNAGIDIKDNYEWAKKTVQSVFEQDTQKAINEIVDIWTKEFPGVKAEKFSKTLDGIKFIRDKVLGFNPEQKRIFESIPLNQNPFDVLKDNRDRLSNLQIERLDQEIFSEFDFKKKGKSTEASDAQAGIFFTDDLSFAGRFTYNIEYDSILGHKKEISGTNPFIFRTYLSMQNPLDLRHLSMADAEKIINAGIIQGVTPNELHQGTRSAEGSKAWQKMLAYKTEALKQLGYDGIINKIKYDHRVRVEYIPFSPTQIKSAFNKGSWDPNNPNIQYSVFEKQTLPFQEGPPNKDKVSQMKSWLSKHNDRYSSEYVTLYHATSPDIPVLEEGLKPTSLTRRRSCQSTSGYVYLAPTPDRAKLFGDRGNCGQSKVYEVQVLIQNLKADLDQLNNQRAVGAPVKNSVAESIVYGGSVRVKGRIEPWQIDELPIDQQEPLYDDHGENEEHESYMRM